MCDFWEQRELESSHNLFAVWVVPDGECESHAILNGVAHAALGCKVIPVTECSLLVGIEAVAEVICGSNAGDIAARVLNDLAVMDVETADLSGHTIIGGTVKLCDDAELRFIDCLAFPSSGVEEGYSIKGPVIDAGFELGCYGRGLKVEIK